MFLVNFQDVFLALRQELKRAFHSSLTTSSFKAWTPLESTDHHFYLMF